MRILINLATLTNSGVIPIWLRKFQELSKHSHQIDIFFNNQANQINFNKIDLYRYNESAKIKKLPKIESKIKFIFYSLKKNIQAILAISKYKNKYDIVYSPSSVLDLAIMPFFLKKYNQKIVWTTVFDNIVPITDPGNKIIRFISWIFFQISLVLIRQADLIFTISPELKKYLINQGFDKNKIIITGNGIEIDLIKKAKKNRKYNFDALFIGRINETKGIFDMLQVLNQVKKEYPNFTLAIMGEGDNSTKNKFIQKIKKMNLQKNVKFLGYITSGIKKFNIIKSSRSFWFLSTSPSESFGIALMEAVSCGIPAFTYKLPTFTKIYKNNEVFFSPLHKPNIVAHKVTKLFRSKNFINQNGKKLLGKYSWKNIVKIENSSIQKLFIS
ncbi:MAG: glycosyltransferase [Candidatus Shapirobacteria bacterium]|nr:glycosyltransferase [Candidatus Shapirobacteria bacterium]